MKVTYLKLENVYGIMVGSNKNILEISFEKSKNKIVSIQGINCVGKSVLISSISPFAFVTSVDDRSSIHYIIPKKDGYKEIHYRHEEDIFVIKHYYKASKDTHSVKSYISKNGEELNENGNVRSFESLVEMHLGLTTDMMRLIRLGTNVNSFITLTPTKRKEYIGNLINEIDVYLKIYKGISEDLRVTKTLMSTNSTNINNCHISDPIVEQEMLKKLEKEIKKLEKDRDRILSEISKIESLMTNNDIDDLKRKKHEAELNLSEFDRVEDRIKSLSLVDTTIEMLIKKRSDLQDRKIDIQSKINSYRLSIDNSLKNKERLESAIKRVTSDNDIRSLINSIDSLRETINGTNPIISSFKPSCSSDDINFVLNKLMSFNQISSMIYTLGNKPVSIYVKLKNDGVNIDKFLKDQIRKNVTRLNENDISNLVSKLFEGDIIISPNCDNEYNDCPYYRLATAIGDMKDQIEECYDDETIRYIKVISSNIDSILNEIDSWNRINIPDKIRDQFRESIILNRLYNKSQLFDLLDIQEYATLCKEYEIYRDNLSRLKEYEHQLSIYKKSGVDNQLAEISSIDNNIKFYKTNIDSLTIERSKIDEELQNVDSQISLVTKYNDSKKYREIFKSTLLSTRKILEPLESASREKVELEYRFREITDSINSKRQTYKDQEMRMNEYNRLIKEGKELEEKYNDLNIILKATSTRKGIPVIFMKKYLGKIKNLANNLLRIIYDDEVRLGKFEVTQDTFEIPYIKNGVKVSDVKYASQSEIALMTMAISFALSNRATGNYNILLIDEIDAGLDEDNRAAFLKMLYAQISALKAEQVFIISHNLNQMINIPMDVIKLSDVGFKSKLQNVIYEQ